MMAQPYRNKPRSHATGRGEPRTIEGRARKKLKLGAVAGLGCVLTHAEMMLVIQQLPTKWLTKECK